MGDRDKEKSKEEGGDRSARNAGQSGSSNPTQQAGPSGAAFSGSLNPGTSNSRTSGIVEGGKKKQERKLPKLQEDEEVDEDESVDPSEGDREADDEEEREGLVKALRRMGIRAPKPFDPKRDRKFETWLDRTEYHLMVTKCPDEDRTACLLLLLDSECYEQAKHLGVTGAMDFGEAKKRLRNYFAVTETAEELRDKLDLRKQEPGESIEAFARDVKLIGHRAYPNGDPDLLEHILIKQFTAGLRDEKSRERLILKVSKTLTEAASYARFAEAAVRVAKNRSVPQASVSAVSHTSRSTNFSGGQTRNRFAPPIRARSRS